MMQNTEPRLTCTGYGFFLPEPAQFFNKSRSIKKFLYYYSIMMTLQYIPITYGYECTNLDAHATTRI